MFKLLKIVGMIEVAVGMRFPTLEGAVEYGNEWLGDEEHVVQLEIEAGNPEAAEYPTWFAVEDAEGVEVYRSSGV